MSSRRKSRFKTLFPGMRDDLVRLAGDVLRQCRAACDKLQPFCDDDKAVHAFADAARTLAGAITGGQVTFIEQAHSSTPYTGPQAPEVACSRRARELDQDVAEAIALHGGDAVAAVRALMILTRFLEDERERTGPAPGGEGPARLAVDRAV